MREDVKVGLVEAKGAWQPHGSRSYTKRRLREAPIRFRRRRRCGRAGRRAAPCAGRGPCRRGRAACRPDSGGYRRSEEHTSELQSLMRISYDVFCLKKKTKLRKIQAIQ